MDQRDRSPLFVGRRAEIRLLLEDADRARREAATAVLVAGDAGVGKSRLLREYAAQAPMGRVVTGGCLELGVDGLPFAPFVTALRRLVREAPAPSDHSRELPRLLPELGLRPTDSDEGRGQLFEEVLALLESRAGSDGLTLVVEDLHWADRSTRDLLVFLLRNLYRAPVQLLISYRTDDLHRLHPLRRLLPELERLPAVTRVELSPLSRAEVARQAAGIRGADLAPRVLDLLYARSGGNPLFVESLLELPDVGDPRVPDGPRELFLGVLRGLDETARFVVKLAALGGDRVDHRLLATVADMPEEVLEAALRAAIDTNVLRTDGEGYAFRHTLLGEAVHEDLLPGERVRLHRRYVMALSELIDDPDAVSALPVTRLVTRLAHHAYAAHDLPRALGAAWRAAEEAGGALAHPERLHMLERVLELWELVPDAAARVGHDHVETLHRAARTAIVADEAERAVRYATAALDELAASVPAGPTAGTDAVRVAHLLHVRGEAYKDTAHEQSLADLRDALRVLPAGHDDRAKLMSSLAAELMLRGAGEEAWNVAQETLRLAREVGDRASEASALITMGSVRGDLGDDPEQGMVLLNQGREIALAIGSSRLKDRALNNIGVLYTTQGRFTEGLRLLGGKERHGDRDGLRPFQEWSLALINLHMGRLDAAARYAEETLPRLTARALRFRGLVLGAEIAIWQDDLDLARECLAEIDAGATEPLRFREFVRWQLVVLRLDLIHGDLGPCRRRLERLLRDRQERDLPVYLFGWLARIGAELWHRAAGAPAEHGISPGDREQLRLGVRALVEDLMLTDDTEAAYAAEVEALLCADHHAQLEQWDTAAWSWHSAGRPLETAAALAEGARVAAAVGDRAEAARRLAEVRRIAAKTGSARLRRLATEAAGGTPAAISGLTPREAQVLAGLTKGRTNREIARTLSISPKTVSVHVSNLFAKLEVTNRNAAAVRARELGMG
ncbi:helix-turn-helix transcriptional regulator [Nocardiopsis ansamitocini]|uniref:Helix-turn-helix transcriptional regulator n=1 Tax=Nocardiopsis ansamitocini TaxID=1670832 RepID=A0A9W6UH19_9ACTN|nr:AAA family ATPase [Nocardiopsis ansamitocini]GLU46129.1 helix-turn-helix transcriptional regulator [Nocardiopsis ansamitocini]